MTQPQKPTTIAVAFARLEGLLTFRPNEKIPTLKI